MPLTVIRGIFQSLSLPPSSSLMWVRSSQNNLDFLTLFKSSVCSNILHILENFNINIPSQWLQYCFSLFLYCSWYSLSPLQGILKKILLYLRKHLHNIYLESKNVVFSGFCPLIIYLPSSQFLFQLAVFLMQQNMFSFALSFPFTELSL